jgi:hypothetical protein
MTFCPEYKPNPHAKFKPLKSITLPKIRKAYPRITASDLVGVQPMGWQLYVGHTYWAKHVGGYWETCTTKDLYDPNYVPHFGIACEKGGYAIWDADLKPIVCTNREIFKRYEVDPEDATTTDRPVSLANPEKKLVSSIFFLETKYGWKSGQKEKGKGGIGNRARKRLQAPEKSHD